MTPAQTYLEEISSQIPTLQLLINLGCEEGILSTLYICFAWRMALA